MEGGDECLRFLRYCAEARDEDQVLRAVCYEPLRDASSETTETTSE
jgi:hypothetical protein